MELDQPETEHPCRMDEDSPDLIPSKTVKATDLNCHIWHHIASFLTCIDLWGLLTGIPELQVHFTGMRKRSKAYKSLWNRLKIYKDEDWRPKIVTFLQKHAGNIKHLYVNNLSPHSEAANNFCNSLIRNPIHTVLGRNHFYAEQFIAGMRNIQSLALHRSKILSHSWALCHLNHLVCLTITDAVEFDSRNFLQIVNLIGGRGVQRSTHKLRELCLAYLPNIALPDYGPAIARAFPELQKLSMVNYKVHYLSHQVWWLLFHLKQSCPKFEWFDCHIHNAGLMWAECAPTTPVMYRWDYICKKHLVKEYFLPMVTLGATPPPVKLSPEAWEDITSCGFPSESVEANLHFMHLSKRAPPIYPYLQDQIMEHAMQAPVYMPCPYSFEGIWHTWWGGHLNTIPQPMFDRETFDLEGEIVL